MLSSAERSVLRVIGAAVCIHLVGALAIRPLLEQIRWGWQVVFLGDLLWGLLILFSPLPLSLRAGRRGLFYGVLCCFVFALAQLWVNWNPQQYPDGRWDYFWALEARTYGLLLIWAAILSLPAQISQMQPDPLRRVYALKTQHEEKSDETVPPRALE